MLAPGLRRTEVRGWNQGSGQSLLAPHSCLGSSHPCPTQGLTREQLWSFFLS